MLKNKICLDVGCGNGFFAHHLFHKGIDIIGIDIDSNNEYGQNHISQDFPYIIDDAKDFIMKYGENIDVFFLNWPPYDTDFGYHIIKNIPCGKTLIYQGENKGGCTGNDKMFDYLKKNYELEKDITKNINEYNISWMYIYDSWTVYTKKTKICFLCVYFIDF